MFKAVIYNVDSLTNKKHYKTMAAAKGAMTRLGLNDEAVFERKILKVNVVNPKWKVATIAEYNALNVDVTVYSIMNGAPVTLRKSDVGGPCDPSTERYWSM